MAVIAAVHSATRHLVPWATVVPAFTVHTDMAPLGMHPLSQDTPAEAFAVLMDAVSADEDITAAGAALDRMARPLPDMVSFMTIGQHGLS